jgi:hypothetical protein
MPTTMATTCDYHQQIDQECRFPREENVIFNENEKEKKDRNWQF